MGAVMRLVTRDNDGKPDTPLSVWIGLAFIGTAVFFESVNIGPGGLGLSWTLGINAFLLLTGLTALIPGLFLTLMRDPEEF